MCKPEVNVQLAEEIQLMLKSRIRDQDAQIRQQDAQIRKQDAEIRERDAEIRKQDAEIRRQDAQIRQQDAERLFKHSLGVFAIDAQGQPVYGTDS